MSVHAPSVEFDHAPPRPVRARMWVWVKRLALFFIGWPLVMTLVYRLVPVPFTNVMLLHLAGGHGIHKSWQPLSEISPALPRAVAASEDTRFCEHHGVDWHELQVAWKEGEHRGASTISMQVAKNLFLWDGHSRVRKALELPLAMYMDAVLGKRRMMEIYLNIAEWGPGVYGAEAASQFHFHKSARVIGIRQSALLAASLPNPIRRVAGRPSGGVNLVASRVTRRMGQVQLPCL